MTAQYVAAKYRFDRISNNDPFLKLVQKKKLRYHHSEMLYEVEGPVSKTEFSIRDIQADRQLSMMTSVKRKFC